jgi:hypothetical protein
MRWDNLFDDLEGQLEQELSAEELDVRAEEERLRLGRLSLRDRIVAVHEAQGRDAGDGIQLFLTNGAPLKVRPLTFGRDWFSVYVLDESSRRTQAIIPMASIAAVVFTRQQSGLSLTATPSELSQTSLPARLTLSFVLRDLCRRRSAVEVLSPLGAVHGTIDRVGRDHIDVAVHEPGEARRESAVLQSRVVPLGQLLLVRLV